LRQDRADAIKDEACGDRFLDAFLLLALDDIYEGRTNDEKVLKNPGEGGVHGRALHLARYFHELLKHRWISANAVEFATPLGLLGGEQLPAARAVARWFWQTASAVA
jgi:hypothetical protein